MSGFCPNQLTESTGPEQDAGQLRTVHGETEDAVAFSDSLPARTS
jgi:hypothetical protein